MSEPECESELSKLQRRFDELMAEAERLAASIQQAEERLPRLEAEARFIEMDKDLRIHEMERCDAPADLPDDLEERRIQGA